MSSAAPQQGGLDRTSHDTTPAAVDPAAEQDQCGWDALVPDPSGREPLGDEPQFAEILEGMVADFAPRVFAVVQVYGERVDRSGALHRVAAGYYAVVPDDLVGLS